MMSLNNILFDNELNVCGLTCPMPVIIAKQYMHGVPDLSKVLITATDPSSVIDFKVFAKQNNYQLLDTWQKHDKYYFLIFKPTKVA